MGEKSDLTIEIMRTFGDERSEQKEKEGIGVKITPRIEHNEKDRTSSAFTEKSTCINTLTPLP